MSRRSKYETYFDKTGHGMWKCRSLGCMFQAKAVKGASTTSLQHHLKTRHPENYEQLQGIRDKKPNFSKLVNYYSSVSKADSNENLVSTIGNSLSNDPELPIERAKKAAAFACGEANIRSGMKIGVGSGSTVKYLVEFLKEKYQQKVLKDLVCIPTSFMTRKWLLDAGLPVSTLEEHSELDIAIDGADEVDSRLNLIKGGGGCLTQEKIVQTCSKSFIVIADANKKSTNLGDRYKVLPIEVVPVAYVPAQKWITKLFGGSTSVRISATKCFPLITDNGNYIIEWNFPKGVDRDWSSVHQALVNLPGVVETGLFLQVTDAVYFAKENGQIEVVKP